jgi:hypothetical protein
MTIILGITFIQRQARPHLATARNVESVASRKLSPFADTLLSMNYNG